MEGRDPASIAADAADPEAQWRASRDRDTLERHLPGVMLTVGVVELLMAARNSFALTGAAREIMPPVQAALAVSFLVMWWFVRRRKDDHVDSWWAIPSVALIFGFLVSLEQALTGNGLLAANSAIIILAASALILGWTSYVVTNGLLIPFWLVAVSTRSDWNVNPRDQATLIIVGTVGAAVVHWIRTADRRRLVAYARSAQEAGLRDPLTGLWNRRGAREVWSVLAANAAAEDASMWCIYLDVRGLKAINDRYGHTVGDKLLGGIGEALREVLPRTLVSARWGGDEFCVFGQQDPPDLDRLESELHAHAEREAGVLDQSWSVSAGLAESQAEDSDEAFWFLVEHADMDMYQRRRGGVAPSGG